MASLLDQLLPEPHHLGLHGLAITSQHREMMAIQVNHDTLWVVLVWRHAAATKVLIKPTIFKFPQTTLSIGFTAHVGDQPAPSKASDVNPAVKTADHDWVLNSNTSNPLKLIVIRSIPQQ